MADDTIERFIKLTLRPKRHADVLHIIDEVIEPGKLASTVVALLRLYPQLIGQTSPLIMGAPAAAATPVPAPVPASARSTATARSAAPAAPSTAPTEEIIMPSVPAPSRVSLSSGFAAFDD